MQNFYVTTYCNFAHDVDTGEPIDHECVIIPPEALEAEIDGDYELAIDIMSGKKMKPSKGKARTVVVMLFDATTERPCVMRIKIEIDCGDAALHDDLYGELERILKTIPKKVYKQLERDGRCVCTALESTDTLKDINGNTVGTVEVTSG